MAVIQAQFPASENGDADDVVLALQTANALWAQNDAQEAIRWLRRAAESAEEAGDDMRALTLARAAADLTNQLESVSQAPAPSAAQPPAPAAAQPARPAVAAQPSRPAAAAQSSRLAAVAQSPRPAAAPQSSRPAAAAQPSSAAKAEPAAVSVRAAASRGDAAPTPSVVPESRPAGAAAAPPPPPPGSSPLSTRGLSADAARRSRPAAAAKPKDALAHLAALASADSSSIPRVRRTLGPYQALRVCVEQSQEDRKLLLVRVLNRGEAPPPKTHEAMLIALEPGADVRTRKR